MKSPTFIETCLESPGGKVVREEAEGAGLSSDHLFAVPTEPVGNALSTSMHGGLARSSPFLGFDGLLGARTGDRKVYVNDVAMFTIGVGMTVPCRLLEAYWDEESAALLLSVRRFRTRDEVRESEGVGNPRGSYACGRNKMVLDRETLQNVCEIYTHEEVAQSMHLNEQWDGGVRWSDWDAFVGEGFAERRPKRRRQGDQPLDSRPFVEASAPSSREGTAAEILFSIRKPGFRHNLKNLVFGSVPLCVFNDAFNAWRMSIKVRGKPYLLVSCLFIPGLYSRALRSNCLVRTPLCDCTPDPPPLLFGSQGSAPAPYPKPKPKNWGNTWITKKKKTPRLEFFPSPVVSVSFCSCGCALEGN